MSKLGAEREAVQDPILLYGEEIGWRVLDPSEAITERGGESGMFLLKTLRAKLLELNPGIVTPANVDEIIRKLESLRTSIEGNFEALAWLRGERTVFVESQKQQRNVTLIDFEHPSNNLFHVTKEWRYTNGQHANRADVMFVVNGIPVALVETKAATKKDAVDIGLRQVRRYHRETPELVVPVQVFNITQILDFAYGVTWSLDAKALFNWKDEEKANFERKVKRFFSRERFLKVLSDWIIFYRRDDELKKIILRQHQTRAVERVVERALDPEKSHGLVWHTQGSGKTFTMMAAAEQLLHHPAFRNEKPTVLMLVDRTELEGQLFRELSGYGLDFQEARSKVHVKQLLESGFRGLIVSMIHKFDGVPGGLSDRDNIFVLVDEAHRSTGGDLGNYLVAALPNATFLGFTGTPIDRTAHGAGTFKTFGVDDAPRGYLDKYSIAESIEDGTTLPLHYTLAPNELRVPKEELETKFLDLKDAEGISDIEELNRILDRAVSLKTFLKADDRVDKVAQFVAHHFKESVEPKGYKAFLVGVDREACALYKKALDRSLPSEQSAVVFSAGHNDEELLAKFHLDEAAEKRLRQSFVRSDKLPKILIVTEKLLTGFDAPVLYCLYLDKPMRDHTLLQAIARVNRPYEDAQGTRKPCGFVVDFVGIFANLEKALSFDSDEVASVIQNVDILRQTFERLMKGPAVPYLELTGGAPDDKLVERAIEFFADPARRDAFNHFFAEVHDLHGILSPDPFLRPFLGDHLALAKLSALIRLAFAPSTSPIRDLAERTGRVVRESVSAYGFTGTLPLVRIDEEALAALKRDSKDKSVTRVINLGRSLTTTIAAESVQQPFLIPLGDRAESILEGLADRRETTEAALAELEKLVREYLDVQAERQSLSLSPGSFSLYQALKLSEVEEKKLKPLAERLDAVFSKFPEFGDSAAQLRALKAELYKELMPAVGTERMVKVADAVMRARG